MSYSFARSFHHPTLRGVGACIPCGSAGSATMTASGASDTDSPTNTRAIATGVFVASVLVGAVGFAAGAGVASTVGLGGVFVSMLVLAMQPTPVKE